MAGGKNHMQENTMYTQLKGKIALVTGAGKKTGIGYAICEKLASDGQIEISEDLPL